MNIFYKCLVHGKRLAVNESKGYALLIVITVTFVVSLFIGLMVSQYIYQRHSIKSSIQKIQSFYTAEAGIKKAFYYLKEDPEKGIGWRTGNLIVDNPLKEEIFYHQNNEVEISVVDDCGYLRIKSRAIGKFPKTIEIISAGIFPDELQSNLCLISSKPLVLGAGSQLKGRIKLNQEPIYRGGSIDGMLETNSSLSLPVVLTEPFKNSIKYFRYLLSHPENFDRELFSPQVFSPQRPFRAKKIFVNDAVLIENKNFDSLWCAGDNLILASTAEIQISGATKISNSTIVAVGPVRILDKAVLNSTKIYSETSIELREEAKFSGILIAPEIKVSEKAQIFNSSLIYCGVPFKDGKIVFNNELPICCTIINLCQGKNSLIEISSKSEIEGFIYTLAPIKHLGKISGFVYCQGFYNPPITEDTTNTNVLSGVIQPMPAPEYFTIPLIFQEIKDFKIIQWHEY